MGKLDIITSNIYSRKDDRLFKQLAIWRFKEKKIVFTNGCFDLIHLGHIDYLAKASELADILIIGLNTDESVRKLKGKGRPIQDEVSRAMTLASLRFVDAVVYFGEDTPFELINSIKPDVLVKGADYKPEDIVGYDIVHSKGGEIITLEYIEGYSTSAIEKRIRNQS
jgi:rfaE bifunctional protein nucleotidyltransferase chain/domain